MDCSYMRFYSKLRHEENLKIFSTSISLFGPFVLVAGVPSEVARLMSSVLSDVPEYCAANIAVRNQNKHGTKTITAQRRKEEAENIGG